jgi:hypothetical protein
MSAQKITSHCRQKTMPESKRPGQATKAGNQGESWNRAANTVRPPLICRFRKGRLKIARRFNAGTRGWTRRVPKGRLNASQTFVGRVKAFISRANSYLQTVFPSLKSNP